MSAQTRHDVEIAQLRDKVAALELEVVKLRRQVGPDPLTDGTLGISYQYPRSGITAIDGAEGVRRAWAQKAERYPEGSLVPTPSYRTIDYYASQARDERLGRDV